MVGPGPVAGQLNGVSIGGGRAHFHRVRARRRAGWSKTVALWQFTKCPRCKALIDGTGDDWRDHEAWHTEQERHETDPPEGPVYEDFETETGEE